MLILINLGFGTKNPWFQLPYVIPRLVEASLNPTWKLHSKDEIELMDVHIGEEP